MGISTVFGNEWFSYFASTLSKSRSNFLEQLHGNKPSYVRVGVFPQVFTQL
ncbi:hypothetical protein BJP36_39355 [Moorena producens JHB]|uniref:Uncharacterized protein n=1 Tax=Moorena producens (strain JHB) TaxID=1454205 RepID=A0A9Q9UWR3_MOOP1|nr:hypothetical protein [Moorena producens]WAN70113.1 hypothetical protein BJP36_39355 [Moorena producens JHB]